MISAINSFETNVLVSYFCISVHKMSGILWNSYEQCLGLKAINGTLSTNLHFVADIIFGSLLDSYFNSIVSMVSGCTHNSGCVPERVIWVALSWRTGLLSRSMSPMGTINIMPLWNKDAYATPFGHATALCWCIISQITKWDIVQIVETDILYYSPTIEPCLVIIDEMTAINQNCTL